MKIAVIIFLPAVILLANFTTAYSQTVKPDSITARRNYWASISLGASSLGQLSAGLDVNAELANHWAIAANIKGESNRFLDIYQETPNVDVTTYNILGGKIFKQRSSFLTVSAGLGLADVYTYTYLLPNGSYAKDITSQQDRYALNIPIEVQMYFVPVTPFAVSIGAYVNINNVKTTAGISGKFSFGRMSTHNTRRPPYPTWLPGPK